MAGLRRYYEGGVGVIIGFMAVASAIMLLTLALVRWAYRSTAKDAASSMEATDSQVCACLLASVDDPRRSLNSLEPEEAAAMSVCLDVGTHMDLSERVPFRVRYFRVAAGVTMEAYEGQYLTGRIVKSLSGPIELRVAHEPWARFVKSMVLYLQTSRRPDARPCFGVIETGTSSSGKKVLCLHAEPADGVSKVINLDDALPTKATVMPGHRLLVYGNRDAQPPLVETMVGPANMTFPDLKGKAARQWVSAQLERCPLVLYEKAYLAGKADVVDDLKRPRFQRSAVPTPYSLILADDCTLSVYSEEDFQGELLWVATGPLTMDSLTDARGGPEVSRWASLVVSTANQASACVRFASPGAEEGPGYQTRRASLEPGSYPDLKKVLGFEPTSAYVFVGISVTAMTADGTVITIASGPKTIDVTSAWKQVLISQA